MLCERGFLIDSGTEELATYIAIEMAQNRRVPIFLVE